MNSRANPADKKSCSQRSIYNQNMIKKTFMRGKRVMRYGVVGATVSLLYTAMTVALYTERYIVDPVVASAIAFAAVLPISFFAHQRVTYSDRAREKTQWRRFSIIGLSSFVIATGTMKLVDTFSLPYWIALAMTWVLIPVTNYIINLYWVFQRNDS